MAKQATPTQAAPSKETTPKATTLAQKASALNASNLSASTLSASTLSAEELIAEAIRLFPNQVFLSSSYGAEAAVLLQMVARINKALPIVLLDTEKLFSETLEYAATLNRKLGLTNLKILKPTSALVRAQDAKGELWQTDPDSCCNLRKVLPLQKFLETGKWKVWITGRKKLHGGSRVSLKKVELDQEPIKLNPLADWSLEQISAFLAQNQLPPHPLVAKGYPSIGCVNCTHKLDVNEFTNVRDGRWSHSPTKTECGIHTFKSAPNQTSQSTQTQTSGQTK